MSTTQQPREMICIACPVGCHLSITTKGTDAQGKVDYEIQGNKCPRGVVYAQEELRSPKRMLTTTVRVAGKAAQRRVPVRSEAAVPVGIIPELLKKLHDIDCTPPISRGQEVLEFEGIKILASHRVE